MVERETDREMTMTAWKPLVALAVAVSVALLTLWVARVDSAGAKSEIFRYSSQPTETQAGAHPDIVTEFELGSRRTQAPSACYCNDPRDVILHTPAGVVANPHVVSECAVADLVHFPSTCPADSQVGVAVIQIFASYGVMPLYRLAPQKGQAGLFAFTIPLGASIPQFVVFNARTATDYGLDVKTLGISHVLPLLDFGPIFWGVPGDPVNNLLRFKPGENGIECNENPFAALASKSAAAIKKVCPGGTSKNNPSSLPIAPLTQNPTTCVGPLFSAIEDIAYDNEVDYAEGAWPGATGCDLLSFDPSFAANPTTTWTDTASGLELELKVPQFQDPNTPSPSELRASTVTLPEGFSINPNAGDGKVACTDDASNVGTELEAECPETSKVGTVELDSSALPAPIHGYMYLGEPKPGNPYRLVLTANGFGTPVKLLGTVHANPATGQLVTEFADLPQTPFQRLLLHFFGSERGLLATPTQCGTYPVKSTFTPWDQFVSEQNVTQFFTLDSGPNATPCPPAARPFGPNLEAGTLDNTAGAFSQFSLKLNRNDGDQNLTGITVTTPPGFLAKLKGVPYCPQSAIDQVLSAGRSGAAEQASAACPAASQVGTAVAGAGAGSRPVHVSGKVYLAGPYKGAPLSLVVVVPAVSGPFDLGNIAARAAVFVDPVTATVRAVSDRFPQIVEGVPLRTRLLQVALDRPDFSINPTNCDPFSVEATITGDQGGSVNRSAAFQVANCADLSFGPKLSLKATGGLKRRGHPAIHAKIQAAPGEANIANVSVTLPNGELLDNAHIGTICTRVEFSKDACPPQAQIGQAQATSPLLDQPLAGPVYLRASSHKLPDLVFDLRGQIDIEVAGRVDSINGRLRASFETVPDAPISSFKLDLAGGAKGLVVNSESLCAKVKKATTTMAGQNGGVLETMTKLQVSCGSKARHKRHSNARKAG